MEKTTSLPWSLGLKVWGELEKKGFETPSPIQILAIPRLLNGDANLMGSSFGTS